MKKIVLTLTDQHYDLIERCARRERRSIPDWIIRYTEGPIRDFADSVPLLREDEIEPVMLSLAAMD